ncbi:MAG TPA: hypothetical protein ENH62_09395 [Marinobacter sp.]|uniref:DnaA N-terminal domain-containing protein n=1 Tax=marine sediment metagenome TaxID=412755 RepID=A0A0F9PAN4_9ZZZZ|nr:hypothetical protein [Marinobacter sp.]
MSNPWPATLEMLRGSTTKATFETWLSGSTATLDGETLTVYVKNSYALDWLENRLHAMISRAVANVAGHSFEIRYEVKGANAQLELELSGEYKDDYAIIVKPDRVFVGTQYFRHIWVPTLGTTLAWLIIELRQRCYWNKKTGEKREHCQATYAALAAAVGISPSTARRVLKPGPLVDEFILSRKIIREYSAKKGRMVNKTTHWIIRLDEPIFDPDEHTSSSSQNDH